MDERRTRHPLQIEQQVIDVLAQGGSLDLVGQVERIVVLPLAQHLEAKVLVLDAGGNDQVHRRPNVPHEFQDRASDSISICCEC